MLLVNHKLLVSRRCMHIKHFTTDASVHREPSMDASGSHCGMEALAGGLRVGTSVVVNSPPSTPHKPQPVMLAAATPVPLRA